MKPVVVMNPAGMMPCGHHPVVVMNPSGMMGGKEQPDIAVQETIVVHTMSGLLLHPMIPDGAEKERGI
jgi:hypothetical protein